MNTGLLHLHSSIPYLLLPALFFGILLFIFKNSQGKEFQKNDKLLALVVLILSHLQLVVGLILYFTGAKGFNYFSVEGFMKDPVMRLYAVEHISVMIIAIVLITMGYSKAKRKEESAAKFKTLSIFYTLGLVLILSRIPWDAWLS